MTPSAMRRLAAKIETAGERLRKLLDDVPHDVAIATRPALSNAKHGGVFAPEVGAALRRAADTMDKDSLR